MRKELPMKHASLFALTEAYEADAREGCKADPLALWVAFEAVEPQLASELLALFPSRAAVVGWFVTTLPDVGQSPAQCAAEGTLSWHPPHARLAT
jgi:hypothetical protein